VIDDLQFLQGKSTQAEFCHTLNALIDAGRQVVIASDRPPSDLESLDDRVRSRLAGGLVVEMGPLGEELRFEILKARVMAARAYHPAFDVPLPVLGYISKTVTHNRPAFRRPRPHHGSACRAQDRRPCRQRHGAGRGDRDPQAAATGIAIANLISTSCPARYKPVPGINVFCATRQPGRPGRLALWSLGKGPR